MYRVPLNFQVLQTICSQHLMLQTIHHNPIFPDQKDIKKAMIDMY
jgi:hypothetical protein